MDNPLFHLEGIVKERNSMEDFEGPLSLILMLLQKNKIEIRDLSVSDILDQYLEYLDQMQGTDLEISSEFVQMASHLLFLKTRMLLTTEEEVNELELLKQSLEQLQARDRFAALTSVLPALKAASETGLLYMTKAPEPIRTKKDPYEYHHEPVDLLKAILALWTRKDAPGINPERRVFTAMPRKITYSVREKGHEILQELQRGNCGINAFYRLCRTESEIVATFVAVLELCRVGAVRVEIRTDDTMLYLAEDGIGAEQLLESFEEKL